MTAAFPALDPVLGHTAAAVLAALLLIGAWAKLRDVALFREALDNYRLLPREALAPAAWLLPLAEAGAGALLLPVATRPLGALLALVLLALVSSAVVVNLRRGRRIDCGCGGLDHLPLSWGLVARNAVLGLLALGAAAPLAERPTVWLDLLAVGLASVFTLGLTTLANQLLANHPRLHDLRNHP